MMKLSFVLLVAGQSLASSILQGRADPPVPFNVPDDKNKVADSYIVTLKKDYKLEDHFAKIGVDLRQTAKTFFYMDLINTYAFTLPNSNIVQDKIRFDTGVDVVEQDALIPLEQLVPETKTAPKKFKRWNRKTINDAPWFLAMVSAGSRLGLPIPDKNNYDRITAPDPGNGVQIYILDTGVRTDHVAFDGGKRARNFGGLKDSDISPYCSELNEPMVSDSTSTAGIDGE